MNTRYGIAIGGPLAEVGPMARRAEEAGFSSVWVPETARTAYITAAVAAAHTERVRIGTSIALAFPRSPVITAMSARDLAELSNGRFVLGLGTQVKRVNELRYSTPFEHPAPKMRELIDVCREVWASFGGAPMNHEGRFYTVTMPPFLGAGAPAGGIPIMLAAVNHDMVALCGERADGFLGHPFTSVRYLEEVAKPALAEGAERAGRKPEECEVVQSVICSIADRTEDAYNGAKMQIAFYGTTRTYAKVFELHGYGHVVEPLRAAHAAGDIPGMIACITDEMADTYAVAGTVADVRTKILKYEGIVDEIVLNAPWASPDLARHGDVFDRIVEAFGPARR